MESGEQLKYITPITDKTRNEAEEMNKRFKEIEIKTEALEKSGGGGNLLINRGFDIWQRGDVFNYDSKGLTYTADRWTSLLNSVDKVEKIINTNPNSTSKYVCKFHRGNNWNLFGQPLENYNDIIEKTVTLSVNIKANKPTTILMGIGDMSRVCNLTTNWQKIEITTKPNNTQEAWRKAVFFGSTALNQDAGTIIELSDAKLELGEIATPFIAENETLELLKCQKYYVEWTGLIYSAQTTHGYRSSVKYPTRMRIKPTLITEMLGGGTATVTEGMTQDGFTFGSSGNQILIKYKADAEIY